MKRLANLKFNLKNRNGQVRSRGARCIRFCAIALVVLALFLPGLLSGGKVAASDFQFYFKDSKTGDSFYINVFTGDYLLFSDAKRSFLTGRGTLIVNDCLMQLRDNGSAKRPDREVNFVYNLCEGTAKAEGQILATGEAFAVNDSQVMDEKPGHIDDQKDVVAEEKGEPRTNVRGEPICIQDDVQTYLVMNFFISYLEDRYAFVDRQKGIYLRGESNTVQNGCKVTLTDLGPDPKHPDRRVVIEYNTCTRKANVFIWIAATGKTYTIYDSDVRNNQDCLIDN